MGSGSKTKSIWIRLINSVPGPDLKKNSDPGSVNKKLGFGHGSALKIVILELVGFGKSQLGSAFVSEIKYNIIKHFLL